MDLFRIPSDRLEVVHHGIDSRFHPVPKAEARRIVADRLNLRVPYFLHVGHLEKRKNVGRLLEAFYHFREESKLDIKIAFSGARNFDTTFFDDVLTRYNLRPHVIELGETPNDCMAALYSAAELLSFPSLWEGFGFPVLESMACGTPVVTSNLSSLPEIAGDAAELVDPTRVEDIAAAMYRLATDSEAHRRASERGLAQAAKFTWERAGARTLDIYRKVLGQ